MKIDITAVKTMHPETFESFLTLLRILRDGEEDEEETISSIEEFCNNKPIEVAVLLNITDPVKPNVESSQIESFKKLGQEIRECRKNLNVSIFDMSIETDISMTLLEMIERGEYSVNHEELDRISQALGKDFKE